VSPSAANHQAPIGDPRLEKRIQEAVEGDVRFDALTRGLYSTDASIYQIEPIGVVLPKTTADVSAILEIAREEGVPVLPRGGGTSQCGQTVGRSIVMDTSVFLRDMEEPDSSNQTIWVEPGLVLDHLNNALAPTGLFFPVDVATSSRATIGGMAGNNSAGARSIRYGIMADNVTAIEAQLADGRVITFDADGLRGPAAGELSTLLQQIVTREADELAARVPKVLRHVAGYNLHRMLKPGANLAELLIGSEGTLAYFRRIQLRLSKRPKHRVLGVCRFPSLVSALDSVQHLVGLNPHAVELIDQALLRLGGKNPAFADTLSRYIPGDPAAVLLVEFAGEDLGELTASLLRLEEMMADLAKPGAVTRAKTVTGQQAIWAVRKAGLNIVMSRPGDRKPVSFIEDCSIPLPKLAEFGEVVSEIFQRHETEGTWYAHASVGCLHVRPGLSMKDPKDVATMRQVAEEVHRLVARLGGSHSGEHGDGLLRSEFIEPMLGSRLTKAFTDLKKAFDPAGIMNPGKIVDPSAMDDRSLFRYKPEYEALPLPVVMDWSKNSGLAGAVEMCNNNGACRSFDPGSMCPSYRVTREEIHTTRGRANILRLAMTGQLGPDGLRSHEVGEALELCVGCKACRRECPTGVDMARLKAEIQHHRNLMSPPPLGVRLVADLPRLAPMASRFSKVANLRNRWTPLARLGERFLGIAASRKLPVWHQRPFRDKELESGSGSASATPILGWGRVVLFADTFNRYFEPENLRDGVFVLKAHGVTPVRPSAGGRPLCCGRTYISAGFLDEAREELSRTIDELYPHVRDGLPVVGLEPSCLLTLRDEAPDLVPGPKAKAVAKAAELMEEYLVRGLNEGQLQAPPERRTSASAQVHGHCHEKALGADTATLEALQRIGHVDATPIISSCCGMAGSFGYEAKTLEVSKAMAELSLLPAVRNAPTEDTILASGFSCRAQIESGSGKTPLHPVALIAQRMREKAL